MGRVFEFPSGRLLVPDQCEKLAQHRCKACGTALATTRRSGPQRCYCDAACRSRAYRERRRNG